MLRTCFRYVVDSAEEGTKKPELSEEKKPEETILTIVPDLDKLPELSVWKYYLRLKEICRRPEERERVRLHLIGRYTPDTETQVKSYWARKMPQYSLVEYGDLLSDVLLELIKQIDKFHWKHGTTFMQFFNSKDKSRLRGAIIDSLRRMQDLPRVVARRRREVNAARREAEQDLGERVNDFTLLEMKPELAEHFADPLLTAGVFNQRQQVGDGEEDEGDNPVESVRCTECNNDFSIGKTERVSKVMDTMIDRDVKQVIMMYYWFGYSHSKIANMLGKSQSAVATLRRQGLQQIKEAIGTDGLKEMSMSSKD